jgi:large subunit ribosomal protein L29
MKKKDVKKLSLAELKAERDELNKKYLEFRFQMIVGHIDNPLNKRTMRRQIARLNTMIAAADKAAAIDQLKEKA